MKKKIGTMALMLSLSLSASAQIELMFHYIDGDYTFYTVMDRTKKLYWMDDDDNTCFEIKNYKKSGNTETFTLEAKKKGRGMDYCKVTTTVDANGNTATIKYKEQVFFGGKKFDIKTTAENPYEQERLTRYFNELAGYPADEGIVESKTGAPSVPNAPQNKVDNDPQNKVGKAKSTAKKAFGKVKGLFKKK